MKSEWMKRITQGIERIIGQNELAEKMSSKRPLRIKFGIDPTRPDLTFGHMVVFNKLRLFQEMGHQTILLIGDYTAMIGDPSGRSSTRPILSEEEVKTNAKTYLDQAFKILDPSKTIVRRNSEWLGKLSCENLLNLAGKMTVAQMIEREDFSNRFKQNTPISLVEFLYPLLQGYDSVVLESDVELGGNDQLFNMIVGRVLQKNFGQSEQAVICLPLLVGLDGTKKMSKSYDNYITFNDSPEDMFGKIMSIPDRLMDSYFNLLLSESGEELLEKIKNNPMQTKKELAFRLTERLYSTEKAQFAKNHFESVFSQKEIPENIEIFNLKDLDLQDKTVVDVIFATKLVSSKKEIKRLIAQNAVKINGEKISDSEKNISEYFESLSEIVFQIGKRVFFKLVK